MQTKYPMTQRRAIVVISLLLLQVGALTLLIPEWYRHYQTFRTLDMDWSSMSFGAMLSLSIVMATSFGVIVACLHYMKWWLEIWLTIRILKRREREGRSRQ